MKNISLHILDIAQNSITASATEIVIEITEKIKGNIFRLIISDNGSGMNKEYLKNVTDPYFTTRKTRKVGLGIPLLKQNVEQTGGSFNIESFPGKGTTIEAEFVHNHIDRPSLGDIIGVIMILVTSNPFLDFIYRHKIDDKEMEFDTVKIKEILDDIPVNDSLIKPYLKDLLRESFENIGIGCFYD